VSPHKKKGGERQDRIGASFFGGVFVNCGIVGGDLAGHMYLSANKGGKKRSDGDRGFNSEKKFCSLRGKPLKLLSGRGAMGSSLRTSEGNL